jgi:hypothetical protein
MEGPLIHFAVSLSAGDRPRRDHVAARHERLVDGGAGGRRQFRSQQPRGPGRSAALQHGGHPGARQSLRGCSPKVLSVDPAAQQRCVSMAAVRGATSKARCGFAVAWGKGPSWSAIAGPVEGKGHRGHGGSCLGFAWVLPGSAIAVQELSICSCGTLAALFAKSE